MSATFFLPTGLTDELIDPAFPDAGLAGLNGWLQGAIAQESRLGTGKQRGPTTRWIGYVFGNPRILQPAASAILPLAPGDPNPFFQAMDSMTQEGSTISRGVLPTDIATISDVTRLEWLEVNRVAAVVLAGGDVHNNEIVFKIANANIDDDVPVALPEATYQDESDKTIARTWAEWHDATHEVHDPGDGFKYICSNSWGPVLKASEWIAVYLSPPTGVTLINKWELAAILASQEEGP